MSRPVLLVLVVAVVVAVSLGGIYYHRASLASGCTSYAQPTASATSGAKGSGEPSISTLEQSSNQLVPPPTGSTGNATSITTTAATLHGEITPNGEDTNAYFQYGTSARYGTKTTPVDLGSTNKPRTAAARISGLAPAAIYHYQEIIETPTHLLYGADECFVTSNSHNSLEKSTQRPKAVPASERP
jgi:hypothetical protein